MSELTMKDDLAAQFQREQLHSAAQHGDLAKVEDLLTRGYPVNRFDELGKTTLHYAADGEHSAVVDRLIEAGANVNAHDERVIGNTPLGSCAGKCSPAMAERLIRAGADPTIAGWMQLTAIDRAARRKDPQARAVQKLLNAAAKERKG